MGVARLQQVRTPFHSGLIRCFPPFAAPAPGQLAFPEKPTSSFAGPLNLVNGGTIQYVFDAALTNCSKKPKLHTFEILWHRT